MINESTNYEISLEYNESIDDACIVIKHSDTGKVLSFQEYDAWIQYVGGNPKHDM